MPATTTQEYAVGPVGVALLASLALQEDALAETLTIAVRDDNAAPHSAAPGFVPSDKLRKLAARGLSRAVCAANPLVGGVGAADIERRLLSLGVSEHVAKGVAGRLESESVLASLQLGDTQRTDAITALLAGRGYLNERV